MAIIITGSSDRLQRIQEQDWKSAKADFVDGFPPWETFEHYDTVIDLSLEQHPERLKRYMSWEGKLIIGTAVARRLGELVMVNDSPLDATIVGMNGYPGFVELDHWEVSAFSEDDFEKASTELQKVGIRAERVTDSIGMVRMRVLANIINEAYLMVQEGAATMAAVDNAMKKGTNYPYGPFEWASRIGKGNVLRVLEALQAEYGYNRVPVSRLLREEVEQETRELWK